MSQVQVERVTNSMTEEILDRILQVGRDERAKTPAAP